MFRKFLLISMVVFLLCLFVGSGLAVWGYFYLTRDLPNLRGIEDYKPPIVSTVLANDGTVAAEFYTQRRYPVKINDVPEVIKQAFLAAEDANFYVHPGIDIVSIMRAAIKNIQTGSSTQGGSTITQQVVKNLLLSSEKKITRKIKEAILSYRLEQRFSKDEILEMYLNQIFFGNNAYGIKAAAKLYFHKELAEITLAEAALLAGLPKAPSRYSPIKNLEKARVRQRYVLGQMHSSNFITSEEAQSAQEQQLNIYPSGDENIYFAPYYVAEVRRVFTEMFRDINPDTEGLQIYTALDINADRFIENGISIGLREVDKRRGWRGPLASFGRNEYEQFVKRYGHKSGTVLENNKVYPAYVVSGAQKASRIIVEIAAQRYELDLSQAAWAKKRLNKDDSVTWIKLENAIRQGDVIEVSFEASERAADVENASQVRGKLVLDQTPDLEAAFVIIDPHTGKVVALRGGYDYQRSQFNRVTQSYRQPGSTFKPVIYLAAIDGFKYTPATIVYDTQRTFKVGDQYWAPENFDEGYLGPITLRLALEKSRNLISADIISRIGVDAAINYARKLGIESPLGRNLSLSLGSSEVTVLELTRAYGVFGAKGVLSPSIFITKVIDRNGKVIYDYENERIATTKQVISEDSAFIIANMLKGVVEHGTGTRVKAIERPVAGKTGTSNNQMDAWFIGFTPTWAAGAWVGFDAKKGIGDKETGGRVAAPLWLYVMQEFLKYEDESNYKRLIEESKESAQQLGIDFVPPEPLEPLDFSPTEGVDPYWVDKGTGLLSDPSNPHAIREYFLKGTEPRVTSQEEDTSSYLGSPEL